MGDYIMNFMVFYKGYKDSHNVVSQISKDIHEFTNRNINPLANLMDNEPNPNKVFLVKIEYLDKEHLECLSK